MVFQSFHANMMNFLIQNGSDQMRIDDLIGQGISPVDIIRAICPSISLPLETFSPTVVSSHKNFCIFIEPSEINRLNA